MQCIDSPGKHTSHAPSPLSHPRPSFTGCRSPIAPVSLYIACSNSRFALKRNQTLARTSQGDSNPRKSSSSSGYSSCSHREIGGVDPLY